MQVISHMSNFKKEYTQKQEELKNKGISRAFPQIFPHMTPINTQNS